MPNQIRKTTVEALHFRPRMSLDDGANSGNDESSSGSGSGEAGVLWCGLGDGKVQIISMPDGRGESAISLQTKRITFMLSVRSHVWSASFDRECATLFTADS